MNSWLNEFCPGFIVCPPKPWLFRNEHHSITDGDENGNNPIKWHIQLVEGKDWLKLPNGMSAFPTMWEKEGCTKMVELLLNMMEPIHGMGKVVMQDRGFCVATGGTVWAVPDQEEEVLAKACPGGPH